MNENFRPNPLAKTLDKLTRPLLEKIDAAVDSVTPEIMCEHMGFLGFQRGGDIGVLIPNSNEDCRELDVAWMPTRGTFDLCKPIPRQYVKWMRENAKLLLAAADAVEAIEETRNMKQIRALVAGTIPIPATGKAGAA